jgi:hypothetical protein
VARPPDGKEPRSEMLRTRVTPTEKTKIIQARGATSESDYLRSLIRADFTAKGI